MNWSKVTPLPPMGIPIGHEKFNTQKAPGTLLDIKGYKCIQMNGQRIWIQTNSHLYNPPSLDCEIFIGKIPHTIFEDELIPLFSYAGTIYEFRLLVQFDGRNRGYAFARYTTINEAKNAILLFNNFQIRPSKNLGLMFAIQNTTLYIRAIPNGIPTDEIMRLVQQFTAKVVNIHVTQNTARKSVIIDYDCHRDATLARKQIISQAIQEWQIQLHIDIGPPSRGNKFSK